MARQHAAAWWVLTWQSCVVCSEEAREMFYHAYDSYMEHAYPWDELRPLTCEPRRWDRRERGTLDDSLGGYAVGRGSVWHMHWPVASASPLMAAML